MTVREQFEQVKEPWGKEAIENTSAQILNSKSDGLSIDLQSAFYWSGTEQGLDYWEAIQESLNN